MKLKLFLVAAFFAICGFGLAPEAGAQTITVRVCNNAYYPANVALSYQPVGRSQFYNEGWYTVQPGGCRDLAQTGNAYIYGYAEVVNDSTRYWSGDFPLCVIYPGPFAFWSDNSRYCATGQSLRNFVTMHATDWGVFTWTLDP
jgi:uncharacterized membrane protein